MLESIRSYARFKGVSDNTVRKAIAAGKISLVNGQVDRERAELEWAANRDGRQPSKMSSAPTAVALEGASGPQASVQTPAKAEQSNLPLEPPSLAQEQRKLVAVKVARAEMDLARARSEMIAVAEVEEVVGELISSAKSRLLRVAHKIGDEVARTADPIACRNVIEHAIREALEDLSRYQVAA